MKDEDILVVKKPEKNYHPIVVDFLKEKMKCFDARTGVGHGYVGFADAFGVKDIGGQFNSSVIGIAVEVKLSPSSIAKKLGQALGYSLFSHRCYLATPKEFSPEHIEMANRLGVGLIEIKKDGCEEILTAQHHEPIEDLFLSAVYNLGWCKCNICGEFFEHKKKLTKKSTSFAVKDKRAYYHRIKKGYVYYTKTDKRYPIFICPECLTHLNFE